MKHTTKIMSVGILILIGVIVGVLVTGTFNHTLVGEAEESKLFLGSDEPLSEEILSLQNSSKAFIAISKEVIPTVVAITSEKVVRMQDIHPFFDDPMFRRFFPDNFNQERRQQGLGSGVIVSKDGYIMTNNHVIDGADEINVHLTDGREFEAEIVGTDPKTDVAVIKIDAPNLPIAHLGDSDKLEVGEWVLAVGNPFGLSSTVTQGIVSALSRNNIGIIDREGYEDFIQTDAAINPGNSGGALVNLKGEVIGINTAITTRSGGYDGVGFAIPMNMARNIMEKLIADGKVARGWLGVMISNVDETMAEAMGLDPQTKGILVNEVVPGSPADEAGLERGDIIVSLNGKPVEDVPSLRNQVASTDPGTKVALEYYREGKKKNVSLTLGELESQSIVAEKANSEIEQKIGIEIANLTDDYRRQYRLDRYLEGVVITDVKGGSVAAKEGLRKGDVILELNKTKIKNVNDYNEIVNDLSGGDVILFFVQRGDNTFFIAVKIPKDDK